MYQLKCHVISLFRFVPACYLGESPEAAIPEDASDPGELAPPIDDMFITIYAYNSEEPGDLIFAEGEIIQVMLVLV